MNTASLAQTIPLSDGAERVLRRANPDGTAVNLLRVLAEAVMQPGPSRALGRLSADVDAIARTAHDRAAAGEGSGSIGSLLRAATAEADALQHPRIEPEHLVLALAQQRGAPSRLLEQHSAGYDQLLPEVLVLKGTTPPPFRVHPDPASSVPIYQQIVAQVIEAVAAGQLQRNDRLPPIRQLAAELGVAPGTVARAYAELERVQVLQTERARGTRVAAGANEPRSGDRVREEVDRRVADAVVAAFRAGLPAKDVHGIFVREIERYFGR